MKRNFPVIALTAMMLVGLSCDFSSSVPYLFKPTESAQENCSPAEPTEQDINDILSFYKKTFDSPGWERSYTVMSDRVAVTWINNELDGLAYFENLLYNCGGAYDQIDEYLSEDAFAIIFTDYDSYEETAYCQVSELRLHQFDVINQGQPYQIRYWADPQSDIRVYITMLVFPIGSSQMDEYAKSLYPQLTECK